MAETSTPHEAERQRVFISFSTADLQRVQGLNKFLKALGYEVFLSDESILPGMRWEDTLEEALRAADVLLLFWTRHAAQSEWVEREYKLFATQFPNRLLVPILVDTTPLPKILQHLQYSDLSFCPLLNDLFTIVRTLKNAGVGKRKIRAAVLQRLKEEGVELRRDERNRLFGLFGISVLTMVPLYFLLHKRDLLVDFLQRKCALLVDKTSSLADEVAQKIVSLPAAYYYTAGVAITAGFITCHTGFWGRGLEGPFIEFIEKMKAEAATGHIPVTEVINRIIRHDEEGKARQATGLQQPELFPVPVHLNQSGNDTCDSQGKICVSMSRSRIYDENLKFFGYSTPPCTAKVIRQSSCVQIFQTDYAIKGIVVRRSPEADEGVLDASGADSFCMRDQQGKQGIYHFANCVNP
jgi:hypothetical protein